MIVALTGFVAGFGHVLAGPDHLAAVAPLAVDGRGRAWRAGLRWGLGHTAGVLLVGVALALLRTLIPTELISSWSERLVGVVLVGIGIWGVRSALRRHVHAHEHEHDGHRHSHVHVHGAQAHAPKETRPHAHGHTAFAVGTLHGLAGSSHIVGVIPALGLPTHAQTAIYLAAFGIGSVGAMVSFAWLVGALARGAQWNGMKAYQAMMYACSLTAIGVGVYWLVA